MGKGKRKEVEGSGRKWKLEDGEGIWETQGMEKERGRERRREGEGRKVWGAGKEVERIKRREREGEEVSHGI